MRPLLQIRSLVGGYSGTRVLDGIDLDITEGSITGLLGRNGVGKTTCALTLMGLLRAKGSIMFDGQELVGLPPHEIARMGLSLVPQGRRIFYPLTVEENIRIAVRKDAENPVWNFDSVFDLFPRLAERRTNLGNQLSGGEQEMLAIGRALVTNPRLLILDEPSDGLAPMIVQKIGDVVEELSSSGVTILLIEQQLGFALRTARDVAVMTKGRITYNGTANELNTSPDKVRELLGMG